VNHHQFGSLKSGLLINVSAVKLFRKTHRLFSVNFHLLMNLRCKGFL